MKVSFTAAKSKKTTERSNSLCNLFSITSPLLLSSFWFFFFCTVSSNTVNRTILFRVATVSAFSVRGLLSQARPFGLGRRGVNSRGSGDNSGGGLLNKGNTIKTDYKKKGPASHLTMSSSSSPSVSPPVPRREEGRVVYVGAAPPGWDPDVVRQAEESSEPLVDPPVPIPDPYGWIRDDKRENEEVLDYLKAETEYTKAGTKHLEPLQEQLYKEFLSSIQETDYTTPRPRGEYWYYTRTFEGKSYRKYCRAKKTGETFNVDWDGSAESPILPGEEVYLDVNELAKDKSYCSLGAAKISPSQRFLAYSVDYSGSHVYEAHIKDLETGQEYPLKSIGDGGKTVEISGTLVWGKDDDTLFYMMMDSAKRPYRLYRRDDWKNDTPTEALLKEELDELYWSHVYKSLDGQVIFYEAASSETSEVWYLKLNEPGEWQCIARRRLKVLYEVEHANGEWWIWTNVGGSPNMKLMKSPARADSAEAWEMVLDSTDTPIFDGSRAKGLDDVTVLNTHVVIEGREGGIPRIWVYDPKSRLLQRVEFDEAAYDVGLGALYEFDAKSVCAHYDSLITPPRSIEIFLESPADNRTVLKEKNVPGYQKDLYGCDRLEVLSRDNKTMIPISVVYRKDVMEKAKGGEKVPLHLYGYGSYGSNCEADFDSRRLPLLDRGMIYVQAHIRGGGEMGRHWYEEPDGAKYLCKKNTFYDFVDVAKHLVQTWTSPEMLSIEGRSAGGLLIGATINLEPELFRHAVLGVPFVDVLITMSDASIPLTCGEWVEWGCPNEAKYFQYMKEYSPINNVRSGVTYPSCWLTGGLHDPLVGYWEPTKFLATLRHANPNNKYPFFLKMELSAGHVGSSDRYKHLKERAVDYSVLLDQLGLATTPTTK